MHADRVDVFHVANGDAVAGVVAQHFVLDFFPTEQRRLEQDLMDETRRQAGIENFTQLLLVVGDATAGTAKRVRRTDHQRVTDALGEGDAGLNLGDDFAFGDRLADFDHLLLETFAVFGQLDRFYRRPQRFDPILFQDTGFVEFDREIQTGLAPERRQQRVWPLARD